MLNRFKKNIHIEKIEKGLKFILVSILVFVMVFSSWPLHIKKTYADHAWSIRQEINIIDGYEFATTGSYATSSAIVRLDISKYSGTKTFYFEVVASTTAAINPSNFYLKTTAGATVATASTAADITGVTLIRSNAFTPSGDNEYVVTIGNETGATKSIKAARIIILQSFAGTASSAATSTQTQIEIGNEEIAKTNTTSAALTFPKYWAYDEDKWDGNKAFYAEVSFKNVQAASSTTYDVTAATTTTKNATYVASVGVSYVRVQAWGGGGGGGAATTDGGGGGGGGGYAESTFAITEGTPKQLVIGRGGAVDQPPGANGSASSTYSLIVSGDYVLADGGGGTSGNARGYGGSVNTGQITAAGGQGGAQNAVDTGGGGGGAGGPNGAGNGGGNASGTTGGTGGQGNATTGGAGGAGGASGVAARHGAYNVTGGGGGGGSFTSVALGGNGGAPGGGGGGADSNSPTGGAGAGGQIILTETHGRVGFALEEDNGAFGSWTFKTMIASTTRGVATTTSIRLRSNSFTPVDGKHYRIVASSTNASATYDIYNAKIIIDSTSATEFTKAEPQYLLANTKLASGTGLQKFITTWDSGEWTGVDNTYLHAVDAANADSSVVTLEQADGGGTLSNSTVTSPSNHATSTSGVIMPASENLDMKAGTNSGGVYGSRILVQITRQATVPDAPTGLDAVAGYGQVNLSWTAPANDGGSPITSYLIYRDTTPTATTLVGSTTGATTYRDGAITNGILYYYRVRAHNIVGDGAYSNEDSATPLEAPASATRSSIRFLGSSSFVRFLGGRILFR